MKSPSGDHLMIWVYMKEYVIPFDHSDEVRLSLYTMDIKCLSSIYRQTKLPL